MNQEDPQEIHPNSSGLHILLFDPEKSTLGYTKSMLKQAFYTVISTGDQSLALKMLEDNAELIDLIMIDDKPQQTDCITFIKKIKAMMESIPIVLLSSRQLYLSAALLQIGACRVVSKPISSADVKSLWKFANVWRRKSYYTTLETAIEFMEKQAISLKSDAKGKEKGKGKRKVVSDDNNKSNKNKKKRKLDGRKNNGLGKKKSPEKSESDHDEMYVEQGGTYRKNARTYTDELHKKCLELAENKNRMSAFSTSSNPFIPSSTLLFKVKDNAEKNFAESNNIYGRSRIQHSSMNSDFGFHTNRVLGSSSGNSYYEIGMQSRSFNLSQNSYFGEKRVINNDLNRFSNLVDNQASFLGSNGDYMRKRQISDSHFNASSYALNNGLLPSSKYTSWQSVNSHIPLSTAEINEENNALSAFSFVPPSQNETDSGSAVVFQESENFKTNLPNEDNNLIQWAELILEQDETYPVSDSFDEISMDEFFKGVFDKPEGSASSTQSCEVVEGFEANTDNSKTSALNIESFAENDYLNGPTDELVLQQDNFGNDIASDDDEILLEIAKQIQLEGTF